MEKKTNILITSAGRRVQLVKYFKESLDDAGNLIAGDNSRLAAALYAADRWYTLPRIDDEGYIEEIKKICREEDVSGVLSLIDPELSLLAEHSAELEEIGVKAVVSPYEACETWFDKYRSAKFCEENGFRTAKTYIDFSEFEAAVASGEIGFPVFIKPNRGSASININKAADMEQARFIFGASDDMIVQEYLDGQELGLDIYVDMISRKIVSIFAKEKIVMRAGETDKARSVKPAELLETVERLVSKSGLVGPLDMDVFEVGGEYYISEINPRFGGGYPLAYECGANFPKYIINNLNGVANAPEIGNYEEGVYMIKYDTLLVEKFEG